MEKFREQGRKRFSQPVSCMGISVETGRLGPFLYNKQPGVVIAKNASCVKQHTENRLEK